MNDRFITDNLSLLCNRASLPGSGLATADVVGNFTGVTESLHILELLSRWTWSSMLITLTILKFIEHWMEFISSGSRDEW